MRFPPPRIYAPRTVQILQVSENLFVGRQCVAYLEYVIRLCGRNFFPAIGLQALVRKVDQVRFYDPVHVLALR